MHRSRDLARTTLVVLLTAAAVSMAAANPVWAQTAATVATELGLMGRWAIDCSRPLSGTNPQIAYDTVAEGRVTVTLRFEPDKISDVAEMIGLHRVGENRFRYTHRERSGRSYDLTQQIDGNRKHTVTSISNDGTIVIENSRITASGAPSAVMEKCERSTT